MSNDSFDIGEYEWTPSKHTATAYETQVAPKTRAPRTYSRRGSVGALPYGSKPSVEPTSGVPSRPRKARVEGFDCFSPTAEPLGLDLLNESLPSFNKPPPRGFSRSHSISHVPNLPKPVALRRRCSVSSRSTSTTTSVRSVSTSSVYSTDLSENVNPNFHPLELCVLPKRAALVENDKRGTKKSRSARHFGRSISVPLSSSSVGSHSFSNLAKFQEEGASSWAAQPPLIANISPPIPSKVPFASEFIDFADASGSSPATLSADSTKKRGVCGSPLDDFDDASAGGFSLSRLSQHSHSRSRMFSPPSARLSSFSLESTEEKKSRAMDIASDDGGDSDTRDGDDSGGDASVESVGNSRSAIPSFGAHPQQLRSSLGLNDSIFGSSRTIEPIESLNEGYVLDSMSSYPDLKFLIKTLRKEQGGRNMSWHVAPPTLWDTTRRASFFQWTTKSLGFTLRAGGINLSYLQISKAKGADVLKLLESSMVSYKSQGLGKTVVDPAATPANAKHQMMDITSSSKKPPVESAVTMFAFQSEPKELTFNSFAVPTSDIAESNDDIAGALVHGMEFLGMEERPIRTVTIEPPVITFCIDDNDHLSIHQDNSRPSMDNHTNARDLMMHMHGESPMRKSSRPPRLSLQSIGSVNTLGTACKHIAASPFPQAPLSAMGKSSIGKCMDFVATPMMKQPEQGWGCCPVDGRDWGGSDTCNEFVINELFERFKHSQAGAGISSSPCLLPLHVDSATPRTSDLGFELEAVSAYQEEAVSAYREKAESPTSTGNSDNDDDIVLYQAGETERSPMNTFGEPSVVGFGINFDHVVSNTPGGASNKDLKRRQTSFAKHKRMSLVASTLHPTGPVVPSRKSLFIRPPRASVLPTRPPLVEKLNLVPNFPSSELLLAASKPMLENIIYCPVTVALDKAEILESILGYLQEHELLQTASLVCSTWSDIATQAHANLMWMSVGCFESSSDNDDTSVDEGEQSVSSAQPVPGLMERPWDYLTSTFPWACFLSEGAFKQVYKVYNHTFGVEEAISIMDVDEIESTGNMNVVGAELAVSVMLSSLVRRGVCPNFVVTRGVFSCPFKPPEKVWGSADNKRPKGNTYESPKTRKRLPKEPKASGRYQYIRMELCDAGDAEEFLKAQPDEALPPHEARQMVFQIAYALHAAADRFSLKHYDVKLLNVFLQRAAAGVEKSGDVVMRYGLGEHTFALRSPKDRAVVAKLADYGTANVEPASTGQPVTIAQFTTMENSPPDFFLLGDEATQGHGHDNFGLGLCMLHLFTGHSPYEEILEELTCPKNLKKKLERLWEDENVAEFSVVRSVILNNVYKDEAGHIIEGEPDDVLYHTLYRYLVLFGIPEDSPLMGGKVLNAIRESLVGNNYGRGKLGRSGKAKRKGDSTDAGRFKGDRNKYSLLHGNNKYIARARQSLEEMDGGLDLLMSLVSFDPEKRATALNVLNSSFMAPLREAAGEMLYNPEDMVYSYNAFSTQN